jgi:predicted RNase H-like HicB family nuclease
MPTRRSSGKEYKPGRERQARKARRDLERAVRSLAGTTWMKRDTATGRFMDAKQGGGYVMIAPSQRPSVPPVARYPMEIAWSDEDRAYVVTVPDLPGLMTHGATYAEAAERGENAIGAWLRAARHWGTPIPLPGSAARAER